MADEIIKHHPNSSYYPYAIVLNRSSSELAVLQDALARFHDSPAYPHLLIQAAVRAEYEGTRAAKRHAAPDEVNSFYSLALRYGDEALRSGSPTVQSQARIIVDAARNGKERFEHGKAPR